MHIGAAFANKMHHLVIFEILGRVSLCFSTCDKIGENKMCGEVLVSVG